MHPHTILAAFAFVCPIFAQGGDADGARNVAAEKLLPQGEGLAAKFAADVGLGAHAAVVFACDFEREGFRKEWDEARDDGGVLSLVDVGQEYEQSLLGQRVLRVTATLGKNTGGGVTKWFEPSDRVFVRFYVRFDARCDYVHHFVTLRANKGLQGKDRWSGFGGAGLAPHSDERFSTALEPWGDWGRNKAPGRWNCYSYWHGMQKSPDGKYWGNAFRPAVGEDIVKDRWICAEFMLAHNTPDEADGEQAFWIDGVLVGHWRGIAWRKTEGLRANALTLESYVTDRWTKQAVNVVEFDNVVIAREYVGPAGKAK